MTKQIDERVVQMRFDNSHFESNVKTTMSTLDKLKQSLHLKGAEKGFEDINSAAKKVDMTHLGKGLDTVKTKFSALQVMGVTALANLTNSAVNAGKRIVESLTIAPVKDGFSEYEMTLNAVQTTMAGTGKTAKEVEKELKKLDEYADKTVYSTADMLNNLPKFTNAGVELEKATEAMIGIANATALAGGDAGKASIAFYNLGQAIGTGYLSRMDYNSINNAGIATMEWKNQMVEAAIAQGTLTKVGEDQYKAGKKTLTLQQLFIDGLQEQWATTDVLMKVFGDYGNETTTIGKKAYSAAQDIKTFSQMMESLKATAGTGWKDTWQIIFGGLDEAKEFWTGLSNFISGIITKMADIRNKLLEGALGKTFTGLADKISGILKPAKKAAETVKGATTALKDLSKVVDDTILGKFGNGKKRIEALTKAGYNYYEIQNKVNEKLGNSKRYTTELTEAQGKLTDSQEDATEAQTKLTKEDAKRIKKLTDMSDAQLKNLGYSKEQIKALRELRNEADKLGIPVDEFITKLDELDGRTILINSFKNIGQGLVSVFKSLRDAWVDIFPPATSEQLYNIIAGFHKLTTHFVVGDDTADKLTRTFKGLFAALDIILTVLGGPIKIAFKVLTKILGAFDLDILDVTAAIGDVIVKFHDWIDSVLDFTKIFDKIGPAIERGLTAVKKWFSELGPNITEGLKNGIAGGAKGLLDIIVNLGKNILEWFKNILGIHSPSTETYEIGKNVTQGFVNGLEDGLSAILDVVKNIGSAIVKAFENFNWNEIAAGLRAVAAFFPKLPGLNQFAAIATWASAAGVDTMSGLFEGLKKGASAVFSVIVSIGKSLIDAFKKVLGINSPSKVFFDFGKNIIQGLFNGLKFLAGQVFDLLAYIGDRCIDILSKFDLGTVLAVGLGIGSFTLLWKGIKVADKFGDALNALASPIKGVGKVLDSIADTIGRLQKVIDAKALEIKSKALLNLAIAIGILAASAWVLAQLDWGQLGKAAVALGGLIGILFLFSKLSTKAGVVDVQIGKLAGALIGISAALLILTFALKRLASVEIKDINSFMTATVTMVVMLGLLVATVGTYAKGGNEKAIAKMGSMMIKLSVALLLMSAVVKILGSMDSDTIRTGIGCVALFGLIITGLVYTIGQYGPTTITKIGSTIIAVGGAMALMGLVVKVLGKMKPADFWQGIGAVAIFAVLIGALIWDLGRYGPKELTKVGSTIMAVGGAMALMGLVVKITGKMKPADFWQGVGAVTIFSALIAGLVALLNKYPPAVLGKIGGTIIAVGAAMALMAIAVKIAGGIPWQDAIQGGIVVIAFGGIIAGLVALLNKYPPMVLGKIGATIMAASAAMVLMAIAVKIAGAIALKDAIQGTIIVGVFGLLIAAMAKATRGASDCMKNLIVMTVAIGIMAVAIAALSFIDPKGLTSATVALGIVMGMFALVIKSSANLDKGMTVLIVLTAAIGLIAICLYNLAKLPAESTLKSAMALGIVMLALAGALRIIQNVGHISANILASISIITLSLLGLAGAMYIVASIPTANALVAAGALSMVMLALAGALYIVQSVGNISVSVLAAIGIITLSLLGLAGAMYIVASIPTANALVAALALSAIMLALSASLLIISNISGQAAVGAAALLIVAAALAVLTPCLQTLGTMSLADIGKGLLALAGALAIIGIAGALLSGAAIGLLALGGAVALIGAGMLMAGAGVLHFVTALNMFLTTAMMMVGQGPVITAGILAIITGICNAIVGSVTSITTAIVAVIAAITSAIIASVPMILKCLGVMITAGLQFLVTMIPRFVIAGMRLIQGILQGIADNIGGIIDAATDIIVNFLDGISRNLPRIIDSGIKLVISFINGMADGIRNNTDSMISAVNNLMDAVMGAIKKWFSNAVSKGGELVGKLISGVKSKFAAFKGAAKDMMDGFIKGVGEKFGAIKKKAVDAVKGAVDAVKNFLGINSPSKLFASFGRFTDEGFIIGLEKYSKDVYNAGADIGKAVNDGLTNALGIHSPAKVMIEDGKYVVQGIAEGIKKDMSAEEAAAQKAKNIENAFKTEFDKWDISEKTLDLESKLWGANNPDATDVDTALKELELISNKVPLYEEKLALAQGKYQVTLDTFGDQATETKEAYNEWLQAQIDLSELKNKYKTTHESMLDAQHEAIEKHGRAQQEYRRILREEKDTMNRLANTFGWEKAEAWAREKAGFNDVVNITPSVNVADPVASSTGANYAQSVTIGLQNETRGVTTALESFNNTCVNTIESKQEDWKNAGIHVVEGFAQGIREGKSAAVNAAIAMSLAALQAVTDTLSIASPSKVFYGIGSFAGLGFVNALYDYKDKSYDAGAEIADSAKNGLGDVMSKVKDFIESDMDTTPRIRPVLDLSDVQNGASRLNGMLSGNRTVALAGAASMSIDAYSSVNRHSSENTKIVDAISELRSDFGALTNAIGHMHIRMDSGTVVGEIVGKIDNSLGQIANHRGRGN